jgi:hypothetical protein
VGKGAGSRRALTAAELPSAAERPAVDMRRSRRARARWVSCLSLGLVLYAKPTFARECPAPLADDGGTLHSTSPEARLQFIREHLRSDAHHARIWSYSWGAIYSALAVGQLVAAPLVSHDSGLDLYVGAGASLLGLAPLVFTPLKVIGDAKSLDASQAGTPETDACVLLAQAESALVRDAANEAQGRSLLFHGGNIVVNVGIFFLLGAGFGHWTSATISLLTGIATGEIMIFTQPVGAREALQSYRRGDLLPAMAAARVAVVPLVARNSSGLVLVLTF